MSDGTPRQIVRAVAIALGLVILAVGVGILVEMIYLHPEFYPSRTKSLGGTRLHWAFDIGVLNVLLGLGLVVKSVSRAENRE